MKQVSYSFGQSLGSQVKRQGINEIIELEFINSFVQGRTNLQVSIEGVNAKLNEIRQAQGQYPNSRRALSKNLGLFYGVSEGRKDLYRELDVASFVQGFKDYNMNINSLGINCDSLVRSEEGKYSEFIGKRYLEENKKRAGVSTTASGLQYLVTEKGSGDSPSENSKVTVHYTGRLVTGDVFDSSVDRGEPISFSLKQVIPGWTEGLQLMNKGAKYRFFIPSEIGYGGNPAGKIPPYSTLIFDVQLIDF